MAVVVMVVLVIVVLVIVVVEVLLVTDVVAELAVVAVVLTVVVVDAPQAVCGTSLCRHSTLMTSLHLMTLHRQCVGAHHDTTATIWRQVLLAFVCVFHFALMLLPLHPDAAATPP